MMTAVKSFPCLLMCCLLLTITNVFSESLPQNGTVADQPITAAQQINQTIETATAVTNSTTETTVVTNTKDQLNATMLANATTETVNASIATTETTVIVSSTDPSAVFNATSTEPVELIADAEGETEKTVPSFNATVQPNNDLNNSTTAQQAAFISQSDQQNVTLNATTNFNIESVALIADAGNETNQEAVNATTEPTVQTKSTTTGLPLRALTNEPNITLNFTVESMHLITDTGTVNRTEEAEATGPQSAGAELGGGEVPLVSSAGQSDEAKNESANSNGTVNGAVSSGTVVTLPKFIPHGDDDCWTDQNGEDTPRWFTNGEQLERGIVWYECQKGRLVTLGCIDENGKRLQLNGTYQSGRYRMKCVPFGENARRQVIGCVPDGQLDKTYLPGESWVESEKQIWWQCVLENAWFGGCVDEASGNRLNVGDAIDRNLTTYECQYKHLDGFQMVPIGCIFDGTRYSVGMYWQDDDFVFYCKLGTDAEAPNTCIECILRNQRLFNDDQVIQDEHAKKCAQRLAPEGYTMCTR